LKSTSDGTGQDRNIGMGAALALALVMVVAGVLGGCTSDDPSAVGSELVTDSIDTVLAPLGTDEVTMYTALRIEDQDSAVRKNIPVARQEVLYMGGRNGTRCGGMLVNFDFDLDFNAAHPESLFTEENIKSVKFSLTKVKYYNANVDSNGISSSGQPVDLYYQLQMLAAPFDSLAYVSYPVAAPAGTGPLLNSDFGTPNSENEPSLRFQDPLDVLGWIQAKEKVGVILTFGAGSDTGLVGYASRDLKPSHYDQLDPLAVGTIPAPNIIIEFNDGTINYLLGPYADTTTFTEVPPAPPTVEEGVLLRTGLRNYPGLLFDLSGLPPNALINRALLSLTNQPAVSFGPLSSIGVMEWDTTYFGDPYKEIRLKDLNDPKQFYSFYVTGNTSLDPNLDTTIQFDVTQAVLRVINDVYEGTRGLLLTGGEDFLPVGSFVSVSPDFYYREFRFLGSGAALPEERPQLKITYSVVNDVTGEGN